MQSLHHVYLIPGFFGFARLGDLMYFHHVQQALERELTRLGLRARVFPVETAPTASILRRAQKLLDTILSTGGLEAAGVHLIGHSTGGLDARVLVSPSTRLLSSFGPADAQARVQEKVRTVVTLSTPHYGSPIAGFFTTAYGKNLLQALSLLTARASMDVSGKAVSMGVKVATSLTLKMGISDSLLHQLNHQLLEDFNAERREAVLAYTRQVREDQGALLQLTPEGMHLFNGLVQDPADLPIYSFVNVAPPPPRLPPPEATVNPRVAIGYWLYRFMWDIVADHHPAYPYPTLPAEQKRQLEAASRIDLDSRSSDGVVPTLSMAWGKVLGAQRADHLDMVGHYGRPHGPVPFADWLRSGAGFGETNFLSLYRTIARLLAESRSGVPPRAAVPGEGAA